MTTPLPKPLFPSLSLFGEMPDCVSRYLETLPITKIHQQYALAQLFLTSYSGSEDTFNAYRKEVERLLQWCWLIAGKPINEIDRHDIREYIEFSKSPPISWISTKSVARFLEKESGYQHNPEWRPYVSKLSKAQTKLGKTPQKKQYQLSNSSLQALFAGLSTFFTFLQQEQFVEINPVQLVRQKSQYLQKQQQQRVIRKLSDLQWRYTIDTTEQLAQTDPRYERHLFLLSLFYLLGLRISEVSVTPGRIPVMGDFSPDKQDRWWFSTVGKGNKLREVAVPDAMLQALKRYRQSRDLSPLPSRGEQSSLLHKERGHGGPTTRQVRNLIQQCFDYAIIKLERAGKLDEAQDLSAATVHWLRHTAISADVDHRPREHVRDDAGHENASITDRYIDADRAARHQSARNKPLRPAEEIED